MKSFTYKALAVAAATACGASAYAGTLTATKRLYAVEAITNSTAATLDNVVYTLGVGRTTSQDFTIILKPTNSATTLSGTCPLPTFGAGNGTGTAAVSVKRASTSECAYEVDVTANIAAADAATLTFGGQVFASHSLAAVGATESVNVGVWDLGETARIDNSADKSVVVAETFRAVTLTATQDTGTTADVNFNSGNSPLFGFLAQNDDTATVASANFSVNVNSTLTNAAGASFNMAQHVTKITFSVTGDFDGLDTNFAATSSVTVLGATNTSVTGVTISGTGSSAVATFNAAGSAFLNTAPTTVNVKLGTLATKSLGVSRTFGVSAVVDPALTGVADQALAGNASWWVWGANAIELRSAFFNNDTAGGSFTRFFFQNTGAAATYSATCHPEAGVTVTYGTAKTGTLVSGTTGITAADICTFSTGKRGSIVFTINSSVGKVKGVYQQAVNGLSAGYIALERPYGNNGTSNGANY